jgi:hypothetical protein
MTTSERYKIDPEFREKIKKKNRERYQNNKAYRERNKKKLKERRKCPEYVRKENAKKREYASMPSSKARHNLSCAKRRGVIANNIKLTTEQAENMLDIYNISQALNEAARGAGAENTARAVNTKYSFAVDHILPLQPEYVTFKGIKQRPYIGLHAPWNLQIIDALDNLSKLNRA